MARRDPSNGWEAVAARFIADRDRSTVGAAVVRAWTQSLPAGAVVLDLGCGPGGPRSAVLHERDFTVYALDAAPTLAAAYQERFPAARVACEPAERSALFGRPFDAVLAWGLLFLLPAAAQRGVIAGVARALVPGGRFLFTAPHQVAAWDDLSTGRRSRSLGAAAYRAALAAGGLAVTATHLDDGENHYFECVKG